MLYNVALHRNAFSSHHAFHLDSYRFLALLDSLFGPVSSEKKKQIIQIFKYTMHHYRQPHSNAWIENDYRGAHITTKQFAPKRLISAFPSVWLNTLPSTKNLASSVSAPFCFLDFRPGPRLTLLVGSNFLPMVDSYCVCFLWKRNKTTKIIKHKRGKPPRKIRTDGWFGNRCKRQEQF